MGGLFGIVSRENCKKDLFFGTDYHSHMGTATGGIATVKDNVFYDKIHDISTGQFKSRFYDDYKSMEGNKGIGAISAKDPKPLKFRTCFGGRDVSFSVAGIGRITNLEDIAKEMYTHKACLSNVRSTGEVNMTDIIAALISRGDSIEDGIKGVYDVIEGSCSLLVLTNDGIYAGRDRQGRTTLTLARRENDWAVASESCAFPNLGFRSEKEMKPGEVVFIDETGPTTLICGDDSKMKVCSFLWIYTGDPSSTYEGINVETVRYRTCAQLVEGDMDLGIDLVSGVPDSGVSHAIGYHNRYIALSWERLMSVADDPVRIKEMLENLRPPAFGQAVTKYRAGYGRSYIPPTQEERDKVARMKLIPIGAVMADRWNNIKREDVEGKSIVLTEDSIVRNTQLRNLREKLKEYGAGELHVRVACPPLTSPCRYLHSTKNPHELAANRAIKSIEGRDLEDISEYLDRSSEKYAKMVDWIRRDLKVTSLRYLSHDDVVNAIGLPEENLCLDCWR